MANERLILYNPKTGRELVLAKTMGSGWYSSLHPETYREELMLVLDGEEEAVGYGARPEGRPTVELRYESELAREQRAEYRTQEAGVSDYVTYDDLEGLQQQVEELSREVYERVGDRDAELTTRAIQVIGMLPSYAEQPLAFEIWHRVARRLLRVMDETWTVEQSE